MKLIKTTKRKAAKLIGVYIIISPNGKVYIGESYDIEERWCNYHKLGKWGIGPRLFNSLKKHGIKNHHFEIIELYETYDKDFNVERETWWKQYYLDLLGWDNVLFCKLIDGKNGKQSEESKSKMRKNKIGKNCKEILQYDLQNNFIKKWPSIISIKRKFGFYINDVLSGKKYTAGGYIWRYKNNPLIENFKIPQHKNRKPINQYSLNRKLIKTWDSLNEIKKVLGFYHEGLSNCCKRKRKNAFGYIWEFK